MSTDVPRSLIGTRPLRTVIFGDGPRPFEIFKELIYGEQDRTPANVNALLGSGHKAIMTHHYFEPVGWVGDFSLPSKTKDRRCTRYGPLPLTSPMPEMSVLDAKEDFPHLDIPRWREPIVEWQGNRKVLSARFRKWFKERNAELCLMSTFATLIPTELIQLVDGWFINFHPTRRNCSWPEFGGCTPWEDMFWARIREVVIAAYFIDDKFDRGQFITSSAHRIRICIRKVVKNKLQLPGEKDAAPNLSKDELRAIIKNPDSRDKDNPMPGYSKTQQMYYLFDNHQLMAVPTALLVKELARAIWHIRRIEQTPPEMTKLDYFQKLFPKQMMGK